MDGPIHVGDRKRRRSVQATGRVRDSRRDVAWATVPPMKPSVALSFMRVAASAGQLLLPGLQDQLFAFVLAEPTADGAGDEMIPGSGDCAVHQRAE